MDLILLPGKSPTNVNWIQEVGNALKPDFDNLVTQYYQHWSDEDTGRMDIDNELYELKKLTGDWSDYAVFAKSAGAILALRAIAEKKINPKKCIFVGMAILWALSNQLPLESWIHNYSVPTLFIQNTLDPAIYFDELKKFLELMQVRNAQLVELPGKSHAYGDIEKLKTLVNDFTAQKD